MYEEVSVSEDEAEEEQKNKTRLDLGFANMLAKRFSKLTDD